MIGGSCRQLSPSYGGDAFTESRIWVIVCLWQGHNRNNALAQCAVHHVWWERRFQALTNGYPVILCIFKLGETRDSLAAPDAPIVCLASKCKADHFERTEVLQQHFEDIAVEFVDGRLFDVARSWSAITRCSHRSRFGSCSPAICIHLWFAEEGLVYLSTSDAQNFDRTRCFRNWKRLVNDW
jgi:hypothetical protein